MPKSLSFQSADIAKQNITDDALGKISKLYSDWADEISSRAKELEGRSGASYSLQRLNMLQLEGQLRETSRHISNEVSKIVKDSIYLVSDAVVQANNSWLKDMGFPANGVDSAFVSVPDQTVRRLITGQIYDTGWSLSKSIWSDNEDTLKKLYALVARGVAENMPISEIAKTLSSYVSPDRYKMWNLVAPDGKRIYPKNVEYNSQRLARTLIQHGYQTSFIAVTEKNPFVIDYIWRANGSRVCQLCVDRDGQHYKKDELPLDHPNGMCTMEPNTDPDIENKLADWINSPDGTFPEIDSFASNFGYLPNVKSSVEAKKNESLDAAWCKKNCFPPRMMEGFGWRKNGSERNDLADVLASDFVSDDYRKVFKKAVGNVREYTNNSNGSYYNPKAWAHGTNYVNLSPSSISKNFSNKYKTIFHELGHAIDDLASGFDKKYSSMPKYGFREALVEDVLGLVKRLDNDPEYAARIRDMLRDNDSHGVQDALSSLPYFEFTEYKGLKGKKNEWKVEEITSINDFYNIRPRWGHSPDYWSRSDAVNESASELFANISSATVCEEEMAYMKECFPRSVECFNNIISNIAAKL